MKINVTRVSIITKLMKEIATTIIATCLFAVKMSIL